MTPPATWRVTPSTAVEVGGSSSWPRFSTIVLTTFLRSVGRLSIRRTVVFWWGLFLIIQQTERLFLLAETVSPQAIAASIKRLADDRALLNHLSGNALRHAEEDIGWKNLAPRLSDVLEKVAQRRR